MDAATLTPYQAASEFLRAIRTGKYYEGDYDQRAHWTMDSQVVAWHHGWDVISDFGLRAEDDAELWLDHGWLKAHGLTTQALADACFLFAPDGSITVPRTRFMEALEATATNDPREFCTLVGIDERDPWVWRRLNDELGVGSKVYQPLREAIRSTDLAWAIELLQANLPVDAIIQLCAIPPMPIEYAIAMVEGVAA